MTITNILFSNKEKILTWLSEKESQITPVFYSSVDVRDSGYKAAVVDTNFFPAGFNNLCYVGQTDAVAAFQRFMKKKFPTVKNILIVIEEHTRNLWYLENANVLQSIINRAGYTSKISTVLEDETQSMTTLKTASDAKIDVYNLDRQICKNNTETFDLVILNHDLSSGIPSCLEKIKLPIIPSLKAGWYNRSKTHHFKCTNEVIDEFASEFGIDPWFFTCLYETADAVTINDETDRIKLADKAKTLLARIQKKYDQYDIKSKPYLFLKSSQGTYGMGVQAIYDSSDILTLNRKNRNKLYKGKSSTIINNFILQEGVESALTVEDKSAEVCIYNIGSQSVGAFYRVNTKKSVRDNLNSSGMEFRKICPVAMKHPDCLPDTGDYCGIPLLHHKFFVYQVVSRLSLLASVKEVQELEMKS